MPESLTDMNDQFKSIFDGLGDKLKVYLTYLAKDSLLHSELKVSSERITKLVRIKEKLLKKLLLIHE